jgi:hypothetical protein
MSDLGKNWTSKAGNLIGQRVMPVVIHQSLEQTRTFEKVAVLPYPQPWGV